MAARRPAPGALTGKGGQASDRTANPPVLGAGPTSLTEPAPSPFGRYRPNASTFFGPGAPWKVPVPQNTMPSTIDGPAMQAPNTPLTNGL